MIVISELWKIKIPFFPFLVFIKGCFCHTIKLCDDTNDRASDLGAKNLVIWHKRESKWYNCDPTAIQCDEK